MTSASASPTPLVPSARASYRTLREIVLDQLLEDIIQAKLKPGQKLVEAELAVLYGVSRGPVREAIRNLESQGLVSSISSKGAVVVLLSRQEVAEIFEIRIELEGLAARLGTRYMTPKHLEEMRKLLKKMSGSLDNPPRWQKLTNDFHATLYRATGRKRLHRLIKDLTNLTAPYGLMYLDLPGRLLENHPDHELLFQAVERRDEQLAERITEEHFRRSGAIIDKLLAERMDEQAIAG